MSDTPKPAEILFPLGAEYKLDNGKTVEIRKWSIETMVRVSQRIPRAIDKLMALRSAEDQQVSIAAALPVMIDEIKLILAETLGWAPEQIDAEMTADDLLGVTLVVWDHCLAGPLAKMLGLTVRLTSAGAAQPAKK